MTGTEPAPNAPVQKVHEQVILPWRIAIRITLRGLKIRLGRSLITVSGVVLGIAFFMSVLTGEGLRTGLAEENRTKTEVTRLVKLVEEEIGSFQGRKLSLLISGPITHGHHLRMLERLARKVDPGAIWVYNTSPTKLEPCLRDLQPELKSAAYTSTADLGELLRESHVLILLGAALPPLSADGFGPALSSMRQAVLLDVVSGRHSDEEIRRLCPTATCGSLTYQMSEAEEARMARREAQARARTAWITVVAMLVTVIGIANAMLMSVTERIREIGTMKCLGALSGFVVKLFLIESFLLGTIGSAIGTALGFVVPFIAYMLSAGASLLFASTPFTKLLGFGLESVLAGTFLAIVAAIYPARVAAKMVPADALRTNV
jgi:ABC-type antimicrobial peptide transport system permease subunit